MWEKLLKFEISLQEEFARILSWHPTYWIPLLWLVGPEFHQLLEEDRSLVAHSNWFFVDPHSYKRIRIGTIHEHQGVGSSTLEMIPRASILHSSSFMLWWRGSGTLLGVNRACVCASGCNLIWYASPNCLRPWNTLGCVFLMAVLHVCIILNSVHRSNEVKCRDCRKSQQVPSQAFHYKYFLIGCPVPAM